MSSYFWNGLVALDRLANALLFGSPDETVSSRLGRWSVKENGDGIKRGVARFVCGFLDLLDRGHCARAVKVDRRSSVARRVSFPYRR